MKLNFFSLMILLMITIQFSHEFNVAACKLYVIFSIAEYKSLPSIKRVQHFILYLVNTQIPCYSGTPFGVVASFSEKKMKN